MTEPGKNRRVVLYGNPALRLAAKPVEKLTDELRALCADLKVTMLAQDGLGLAANQIGVPVAIYAISPRGADEDAEPYCILNPVIVANEGLIEAEEGCLSLPGIYDFLPRPEYVKVSGMGEDGKPIRVEGRRLLARALIHEFEHLQGKLFIDHLSETRRKMLKTKLDELESQEAKLCG
jgi:peptide deformylase